MDADLLKLMTGTGGVGAAAIWFYLWRGRGKEMKDREAKCDAELKTRDDKINSLQEKIQAMFQARLDTEPQRLQTLDNVTRAIMENTAIIREKLKGISA